MTDIIYGITEEIYSLGDNQRVSYGIAAYSNSAIDSTATIIVSVRDVSADKNSVEHLVNLCNKLSVSILHLEDVIEDFFGEQ